jgi:hypothetical protein
MLGLIIFDPSRSSLLLVALATRSRGYTNKTHLRGLKIFLLVHAGGLLFETLFAFGCVVANYIRPKLFKQPVRLVLG